MTPKTISKMIYSRDQHFDFLEKELKAQNDQFLSKVQTPAIHLLEVDGEIFLGKFMGIKNGQVILKMNVDRGLPRKGMHLNAIVLPSDLRNYHNWDNLTYGDLAKRQDCNCELACVWYSKVDDRFSLVGFSGVTTEFFDRVSNSIGIIFVLGPQVPPSKYLFNLQQIVKDESCGEANEILDEEYNERFWDPISLDDKEDVASFLITQLSCSGKLILQGPPGTGKTTVIATICQNLLTQNKSVLVTAMTNRALMEIASKKELNEALSNGLICKTNLTLDEITEIPNLLPAKTFCPMHGKLLLSTNYISSDTATESFPVNGFDYVIIDEASQAILPMFAAAVRLGKNQLWVGDIKQLPPVTLVHEKTIQKNNYAGIIDGFKTLSTMSSIPNYQLTRTYRLSPRGSIYTNFFYGGILKSKSVKKIDSPISSIFDSKDGPSLVTMDMPQKFISNDIMATTVMIVNAIYKNHPNAHVAVLSCFKETTKHLHRAMLQCGMSNKNLIVETIARIQGLTTDYTVFVIPNTSLVRSLEPRLFNVATSRARKNTVIIADSNILANCHNEAVYSFMSKLYNESHIHIKQDIIPKFLLPKRINPDGNR